MWKVILKKDQIKKQLKEKPHLHSLFYILITYIMANIIKNYLSLATWNMKCNFEIAGEYLKKLKSQAKIILIQEHGLFSCEIPKLRTVLKGYDGIGVHSTQLMDTELGKRKGIGGCAILWDKNLSYKVKRHIFDKHDRMCMLELNMPGLRLFVICVYLPHQTCKISNFSQELEKLRLLLEIYMPQGVCIVLGDYNIAFGREFGIRCSGSTYPNARPFMNLMQLYNMSVIDLDEKGRGNTYTFVGGHGVSYLDHVAVPLEFAQMIDECVVLPDCKENVSDHLAMIVNTRIELDDNKQYEAQMMKRIAWEKLLKEEIEEKYTTPLELRCQEILQGVGIDPNFLLNLPEYCNLNAEDLDNVVLELVTAMVQVSETLRTNEFNPNIKPYWTDELDTLADARDAARKEWRVNHKDDERENPEFERLKECKREFRRKRRIEIREYNRKEMNELNDTSDIDQKFFWWLVNRYKAKIVSPVKSESGNIVTDPEEIQKEWNSYYESLFKESGDENYDDDFKEYVENEIKRIEREISDFKSSGYLTGGPITLKEIDGLIKKMKNNKAPGYDKVTSEHLKYCGPLAKSVITWVINGMIKTSTIPMRLKKGLIISIPKPNKDSLIKGNNRGITLLPALYKVLENVIILREDAWLQNVVCPIQSCGKKHVSCTHTSFVVQQAVTTMMNELRAVFGGFLDTQKAFDTLWILGLLYKLHMEGINPKAWFLIKNAYTDFQCTAYVNGISGPWFIPLRGVHQGAPLSMALYTIFNNCLIKKLSSNPNGICIRNQSLCSPAHADDIALLSLQKVGLNTMFKDALSYSVKWRYDYNFDKTVYMCWGNDEHPHIPIVFGNEELEPKTKCKHMGVTLTSEKKNCEDLCRKRIGGGKHALFAGLGIGGQSVRTSPVIMSRIYMTVVVPKVLYGIEATPLNNACLDILETNHRENALLIQNLPTRTPTPASLSTIGWQRISAFIAYLKIMFLLRILCLDRDSIYRKLAIAGLDQCSELNGRPERVVTPIGDILKHLNYYRMSDLVHQCLDRGQWKMVASLKEMVKKRIQIHEEGLWKATCLLYRDLALYSRTVRYKEICIWWKFVSKSSGSFKSASCVVALLCGTQPNGYGVNFGRNQRCKLCDSFETETIQHVVMECNGLNDVRGPLMMRLREAMPQAMRDSFAVLNNTEKLIFLISGLGCDKYEQQWNEIYVRISKLIFELYRNRSFLYKRYENNQ